MNLAARVKRMEVRSSNIPVRFVVVTDHTEMAARESAMRSGDEIDPGETVVFLITGVPRFEVGRVCVAQGVGSSLQ
jgi:hypothetical protein